MPPFYSKY